MGRALIVRLEQAGHTVTQLVRREPRAKQARWYPEQGVLQPNLLEQPQGFINLSGDNIAKGRWNETKKQRIRSSRVQSTRLLAETMAKLDPLPKVFVSASAIGYYGDRSDEMLTESSPPADDFLSEVCQAWEQATQPAKDAGIRVVNLRIGMVLSSQGAALQKMLLPFKLGLGGVVGSGQQYWSCISRPELVNVIQFAVENESVSGPVNAVSVAVTNREFTKSLGKALGRPTLFPMPGFAAKLVFGEMAEALMLSSTRVSPEKLKQAGYTFSDSGIGGALKNALTDAPMAPPAS